MTYESGNIKTTVDYVLLRRQDLKDVKDVKVIPGEECIFQHKLLVMDLGVRQSAKKYIRRTVGKLKTWKLRTEDNRKAFKKQVEKINIQGGSVNERWKSMEEGLRKAAETVCGRSKGGGARAQTWWWNRTVAEVLQRKKKEYKKWRKERSLENWNTYKMWKKEGKKAVAKAMHEKLK